MRRRCGTLACATAEMREKTMFAFPGVENDKDHQKSINSPYRMRFHWLMARGIALGARFGEIDVGCAHGEIKCPVVHRRSMAGRLSVTVWPPLCTNAEYRQFGRLWRRLHASLHAGGSVQPGAGLALYRSIYDEPSGLRERGAARRSPCQYRRPSPAQGV